MESINKEAKIIISSLEEITEDKLDELEKLTKRVTELETELNDAKSALKEKEDAFASRDEEAKAMETELAELREYKANIEKEVENVKKLDEIREKFSAAGIEKEDSYFDENAEKLLSLDKDTLDFMIQEQLVFSSKNTDKDNADDKEGKASKLPNFKTEGEKEYSVKEIAEALRERNKAK